MDGRRGQQSACANGNNPPSTTLKYTISRFTAITPPKRGGAGPGKTFYGDGAWKTTGNMEEGRPDEVGRISVINEYVLHTCIKIYMVTNLIIDNIYIYIYVLFV